MRPLSLDAKSILPADGAAGRLLARVFRPGLGPAVARLDGNTLVDVTKTYPTTVDLIEDEGAIAALPSLSNEPIGTFADILANTPPETRDLGKPHLLSPIDLQPVKAAGVTFAISMLERVIEERAKGSPALAAEIRAGLVAEIGVDLSKVRPGTPQAAALKQKLIALGLWSQYLEVGIGPDAEVFTKAPVLSSVGCGMDVGLHPMSTWNNPEPEVVLVVSSRGKIVGATLGNDVNLRDVEGRSALLLGKAKDNNASAALGPFVRLFDETFTLDDVRRMKVSLRVEGEDGFVLDGSSDMAAISRDPEDLVAQTIGKHHQYPDGFVLYCGTLFAPIQDRDAPGKGFSHKLSDVVTIASPKLGALVNRVRLSTECEPWTFGLRSLRASLRARGV